MNINERQQNNVLIIGIAGRLESSTSEALENTLVSRIDDGNIKIVIDFTELEYISSSGLRTLLMAAKKIKARQGGFVMSGMGTHIREVFEVVGLLPILTVIDDVEAAIDSLG